MKKIFTFIFLIMFSMANAAFAHHYDRRHGSDCRECWSKTRQGGGFTGGQEATTTTVSNAKKLKDDSYVVLQGNIVSKSGNEKYIFKDKTGTIEIEIDDEDWGGIQAGPKDTVIIEGEIDRDFNSISIDVDTIRLAE